MMAFDEFDTAYMLANIHERRALFEGIGDGERLAALKGGVGVDIPLAIQQWARDYNIREDIEAVLIQRVKSLLNTDSKSEPTL